MSYDDARISGSRCEMSNPLLRLKSEGKPEKPHPQLTLRLMSHLQKCEANK